MRTAEEFQQFIEGAARKAKHNAELTYQYSVLATLTSILAVLINIRDKK